MNEEFIGGNPSSAFYLPINIEQYMNYLLAVLVFTMFHLPSPDSENKVPMVSLQIMWLPGVVKHLYLISLLMGPFVFVLLISPLLIAPLPIEDTTSDIREVCVPLTSALLLASVNVLWLWLSADTNFC